MLFLIISIIICVVIVIAFIYENYKDDFLSWGWVVIDIFVGFLLFIVLAMCSCGISAAFQEAYYETESEMKVINEEEYELVTLQDSQMSYVYRRDIERGYQYTVMYKTPKGYVTESITGKPTYIVEIETNETPRMRIVSSEFSDTLKRITSFAVEEVYIYVPKGTIVEDISIDLE